MAEVRIEKIEDDAPPLKMISESDVSCKLSECFFQSDLLAFSPFINGSGKMTPLQ